MYQKHVTGKFGETEAKKYLIQNNYIIIESNFRCKAGEIDIIAKDVEKNELVFLEVKTRNNMSYGKPAEAVTEIKRKHIFKAIRYFLHIYNLENEFVRIDVIEVYINADETYKLNHIKQVF